MKDVITYILEHIVEHPDDIEITQENNENGSVQVRVKVARDDMGRVIGKEGKIIKSIRDVVKILALKQNKHVDVTLVE